MLFNVIFSSLIMGQKASMRVLQACFIVIVGLVLGCYGEANFSWNGVIYGVLSSIFMALYSVLMKKSSAIVDGNHW